MSLLALPRSKSLPAKGNTPERRLVLPLSLSSGQAKEATLVILSSGARKGMKRSFGRAGLRCDQRNAFLVRSGISSDCF